MSSSVTLRRPRHDDLAGLHAVYSDARTWLHLPSARFAEERQTALLLQTWLAEWDEVGLSTWTVEVDGAVVGNAGVMPRGEWWNVGFRLAPEVWGRGIASDAVRRALAQAHDAEPTWPVVARSMQHNVASGRVSEAAGLKVVWTGPRPHARVPGATLVIHADRLPDRALLDAIVALG
ncbi:MAG: GNAT family N-acetyltransferase [Aeromicrobium erythreum]